MIQRWRLIDDTVGSGFEPAPFGPWVHFTDHLRAVEAARRAGYSEGHKEGYDDAQADYERYL